MSDSYQPITEPTETSLIVIGGGAAVVREAPPKPQYLNIGADMVTNRLYLASNPSDVLRQEFADLVKKWERETAKLSVTQQQVRSLFFLQIIGLGDKALPLIFDEFASTEGPAWPIALKAITRQDPAQNAASYDETIDAWLKWGAENGYWG